MKPNDISIVILTCSIIMVFIGMSLDLFVYNNHPFINMGKILGLLAIPVGVSSVIINKIQLHKMENVE